MALGVNPDIEPRPTFSLKTLQTILPEIRMPFHFRNSDLTDSRNIIKDCQYLQFVQKTMKQ